MNPINSNPTLNWINSEPKTNFGVLIVTSHSLDSRGGTLVPSTILMEPCETYSILYYLNAHGNPHSIKGVFNRNSFITRCGSPSHQYYYLHLFSPVVKVSYIYFIPPEPCT